MASKYRLNRYNWLGQKLLTQHKYDNILRLKQCLSQQQTNETDSSRIEPAKSNLANGQKWCLHKQVSEYMVYLSSLALMQTSTHLDEVIYSIQRLNFENNNQYFLLLCQCLLYLGNHESVIALCERIIAKEINNSEELDKLSSSSELIDVNHSSVDDQPSRLLSSYSARHPPAAGKYGGLLASNLSQEDYSPLIDSEFKKLFQRVDRDHLITEPRLWFILGLCLEYRNRAKDALVAYKVSSNLALGTTNTDSHHHHHHQYGKPNIALLNNFHESHLKYAQLCIRVKGNFKRASQVLSRAVARFPQNYTLNPLVSLISCSGHSSNTNHFIQANEMLATLENYSASNRNPSASYNNLALRCQQRLLETFAGAAGRQSMPSRIDLVTSESSNDDDKFKLHYLLIKVHLQVNHIVQDSSNRANLFSRSASSSSHQHQLGHLLDEKIDQLIGLMRNSDVSCWQSSSLWNNLAVCQLLRGKLLASLTCFMKAHQSDLLDWRICYNLALACIQVGLVPRALCLLMAAKQFYKAHESITLSRGTTRTRNGSSPVTQTMNSLMAVCFDKMGHRDEARRLHIEATRSHKATPDVADKPASTPILLALINYLIFLHKGAESDDSQTVKLKLHLLDLVEQLWLQRNQNDGQFNVYLLDVAHRIGQETSKETAESGKASTRKTYAWTKVDENASIIL